MPRESFARSLSLLSLGTVIGAAGYWAVSRLRNRSRNRSQAGVREANALSRGADSDLLHDEQLSRNRQFFGEGQDLVEGAFVIVVGAGGVGSHAAHMLLRAGVRKLRIIDFDNVSLSSLNRHACATRTDVGTPKVLAMKKFFHKIAPFVEVDAVVDLFSGEKASELLDGSPDFIVDCIDDAQTKADLINYCVTTGVRFISSLGSGTKADPTRIHIGDITDCIGDPLATKMRWMLSKHGIHGGVPCVYSSEHPRMKLLPLEAEEGDKPDDFGALPNFRVRVVPVLGTMPALFGQAIAAHTLCELAGQAISGVPAPRMGKSVLNKMINRFDHNEVTRGYLKKGERAMTPQEADFLLSDVWRNRSSISQIRLGGNRRMMFARWRSDRGNNPSNIVFVTDPERQQLEEEGWESFPREVIERVEQRLAWVRSEGWP